MAEFASKGWAALNTVLGSIGTAGSGILGNIFGGGNCGCSENTPVNRYELQQEQKIADLQAQVSTDKKLLEVYKYFDGKIEGINQKLADQAVYNATSTASISCLASQINQLQGLVKIVVPITSVCPQPAVATTPTTAG